VTAHGIDSDAAVPYFLTGAVLASTALFLMPNSSAVWMAAGMLWILDASINITMEPFRAFVADKLPEEQRTLGICNAEFLYRHRTDLGKRASIFVHHCSVSLE
jgi:hypothetical protein